MKKTAAMTIRQGDVALTRVDKLPAGCKAIPDQDSSIILAFGEKTGHCHRIADHVEAIGPEAAGEIADAAIARVKARLWQSPAGDRYLEVREAVTLQHEEHAAHTIPPGIYEAPIQVSWDTAHGVRQVQD
jgi:hypothetical protein